LRNQWQLLESAQKILSKRESSFNMMISSAVPHAAVQFKNHLSGLNMELLCQDFTMDDAECETLVSSAFDAAQDFVSSYDSASLVVTPTFYKNKNFVQIGVHIKMHIKL
jgi:hypothetical protein